MEQKMKIFICCGTHWDREWYQTFQGFRYRLVKMVDEMMDKLDRFPEITFVFDGQTVVLEDYLEIAPENKERMTKLIREGRIIIGPWYDMPDELIISGESLIHNLQLGHAICRKYGVKPMKNGYICDIFGHTAQTPQIFAGFDIHNTVLGRGTNEHTTESHFLWEAPDGTRCVAFKMDDEYGYSNLFFRMKGYAQMTEEEKDSMVRTIVEKERARSPIPVLLLMDGCDHTHLDENDLDVAARIRRLFPGSETFIESFDAFDDVINRFKDMMKVKKGELIEPAKLHAPFLHLIPNTVSSRRDIKIQNDICQTRMEKWTMPITAVSTLRGYPIRKSYSDLAYKYLIQNHPHDSICGCSIDQVHKDMVYRFDQCREISTEVRHDAVKKYASTLETKEGKFLLSIVNPLPYARHEWICAQVTTQNFPKTRQEPFGYEKINNFRLLDEKGREIAYKVRSNMKNTMSQDEYGRGDVVKISFVADLRPMGITEFEIVPEEYPVRYFDSLRTSPVSAENGLIALTVCPDGTLEITDKKTDKTYRNLLRFSDSADIGDGWFMAPPAEDRLFTSVGFPTSISVVSDGPDNCTFRIVKEMKLPKAIARFDRMMPRQRRSEETETLTITSDVTLARDERIVRIRSVVDNTVRDHRLKVEFETGVAGNYQASESFCFVDRKPGRDKTTENWKESDVLEKAFHGIMLKRSGNGGLAFISGGGVHECAGADDKAGTMAITMLRCFDKTVETDFEQDGEIQGEHIFDFLLAPLDDSITGRELQKMQDCLAAGIDCVTSADKDFSSQCSFMEVEGAVYSTGKLPESGEKNTIIVRLYNPTDETAEGTITFQREIVSGKLVNLNEEVRGEASFAGNRLQVTLAPWKIQTVCVTLK